MTGETLNISILITN